MARTAPVKKAPAKTKTPVRKTQTAPKNAVPKNAAPKPERYGIKDLQADIAGKLPLVSRGAVDRVVEEVFSTLGDAFVDGKCVNIKDFGKFEVKHRQERQGRNPATGESIVIPAKTVPKFTFSKSLKEAALEG